jgi:NMD protein affecting ribosome stability and mRNA decay
MFVTPKDKIVKSKKIEINSQTSKICSKHAHPVLYPAEYKICPSCSKEKLTQSILGIGL